MVGLLGGKFTIEQLLGGGRVPGGLKQEAVAKMLGFSSRSQAMNLVRAVAANLARDDRSVTLRPIVHAGRPGADTLITEKEAAKLRRQSVRTLQAERQRGDGCPYVKLGRTIRYRRQDVTAFIEASIVYPNSGNDG